MKRTMILTGDVNLLTVTDPQVPFAKVADTLQQADVVFGNMECCLYDAPEDRPQEGFYVPVAMGAALKLAGYHAVGTANNVNYGAPAIRSSLAALDELGIAHTGTGLNRDAARAPVILERGGLRFGFLQRTCVYWSQGHEAGERFPGVAALKAHTAYKAPFDVYRAITRPGVPPEIITWADPEYLAAYKADVAALRQQADVVVASVHWGLEGEVLQYQFDVGRAAIEAGADIVMGHGPHLPLGMEVFRDKPIFYGLGNFSFNMGHLDRKHGDWLGMLVRVTLEDARVTQVTCQPVRHSAANETFLRQACEEPEMALVAERAQKLGTTLRLDGAEVQVWPQG